MFPVSPITPIVQNNIDRVITAAVEAGDSVEDGDDDVTPCTTLALSLTNVIFMYVNTGKNWFWLSGFMFDTLRNNSMVSGLLFLTKT